MKKYRFNKDNYNTGALHPDGLKNPPIYYAIPPTTLAHSYAADPNSLSDEEMTRLQWEGGFQERSILEMAIPPLSPTDPILMSISKRLRIPTETGFSILL